MINTFTLESGTHVCNWTLIDPELRFAFSHLAYSPTVQKFTLIGFWSFPVTFFASCTNITHLGISRSSMEDHGSLEKSETDSIVRLRVLKLYAQNRGVKELICGRRQDGSPILDFSHLQTTYTNICGLEAFHTTQELLNGASEIVSLSLEHAQSTISMISMILNPFFHSQWKIQLIGPNIPKNCQVSSNCQILDVAFNKSLFCPQGPSLWHLSWTKASGRK